MLWAKNDSALLRSAPSMTSTFLLIASRLPLCALICDLTLCSMTPTFISLSCSSTGDAPGNVSTQARAGACSCSATVIHRAQSGLRDSVLPVLACNCMRDLNRARPPLCPGTYNSVGSSLSGVSSACREVIIKVPTSGNACCAVPIATAITRRLLPLSYPVKLCFKAWLSSAKSAGSSRCCSTCSSPSSTSARLRLEIKCCWGDP